MKRIIFAALSSIALFSSAQLVVNSRGQLVAGKESGVYPVNPVLPTSTIGTSIGTTAQLDSLSQIAVLGKGTDYSGGYISFGNGSSVTVGEKYLGNPNWPRYNILTLKGTGGIEMIGLDGTIMYANDNGARVNGDLQANGLYMSSDSRLKSEVENIASRTAALDDISGVSYVLNTNRKNSAAAEASRTRFGFIAQEVKEYYPELVKTDEDGYLSVDYVGFIPLLLESVKELRKQVADQQQTIETLTATRRNVSASADSPDMFTEPAMSQNRPNPFSESTTIDCTLPETVADASLHIYDLQGKQLLSIPVPGRGRTSVTVEASRLGAGMYIYALIADGREIDSRRMIVNE